MPNAGHSVTFDMPAHSGIASLSPLILHSALAMRVHSHLAARRQAFDGRADSAANQFGAPESVEDPRHISVVSGLCLPLASS